MSERTSTKGRDDELAPASYPQEPAKALREIFVFGSNLAGRHGKGAALYARQHHGAIYGRGEGLQGYSYAIPTKDDGLRTLPLDQIETYVGHFLHCVRVYSDRAFRLTPIGCGLAGYKPHQIAPMFRDAPENVILPPEFEAVLGSGRNRADATPNPLSEGRERS